LNNLEKNIKAQKQKETEEAKTSPSKAQQQKETKKAKPHQQTPKTDVGSHGTEATQIILESSSNDLSWEFKCENCQGNDVICRQYNGHVFTHSDCKKLKKEAEETDLKCKCKYIHSMY